VRPTIIAALLAATTLACCTTTSGGETAPDWSKIDVAGDEAITSLEMLAKAWEHRPEDAERLLKIRDALILVDNAVHNIATGGQIPADLDEAIQAAMKLVDSWMYNVDPEDKDLIAALITTRITLSMVRVAIA
jgi:hypothetical protein